MLHAVAGWWNMREAEAWKHPTRRKEEGRGSKPRKEGGADIIRWKEH